MKILTIYSYDGKLRNAKILYRIMLVLLECIINVQYDITYLSIMGLTIKMNLYFVLN